MKKDIRIYYLIPSIITLAGTCSALTGIRFALYDDWKKAVLSIIFAAILDGLDGRVARMLNATSSFGEILDSLSDFVSFGVAPGFIMYFWVLQNHGDLGWGVALFFMVCCLLRLARFNFMLDRLPHYAKKYFQGLPAPSGGIGVLIPIMLSFTDIHLSYKVSIAWVCLVAILMISILPMFSFKNNKIPTKLAFPFMVIIGLLVVFSFSNIWLTLTLIFVLYLFTIPVSYILYNNTKKKYNK